MRSFNTAGPCDPDRHYMLPAEERLPEGPSLVEGWHYFVVHAPRQAGKSTALRALARQLTAAGQYAALWFSCEPGEAADDDYGTAELQVLAAIRREARVARLPARLTPPDRWPDAPPGSRLVDALAAWSEKCPVPLALFFDEIDALHGKSLVSVLRQIRAGFPSRPSGFPASVVSSGLRDVRDYKAASGRKTNGGTSQATPYCTLKDFTPQTALLTQYSGSAVGAAAYAAQAVKSADGAAHGVSAAARAEVHNNIEIWLRERISMMESIW